MPTGYTASVQDGTITSFKEFATQCLRGMGVCITMRDDPWDTPIPEKFEPSSYEQKSLEEAKKDLSDFLSKSLQELQEMKQKEFDKTAAYNKEQLEKSYLQKQRYELMLAKVKAWNVPETSEVYNVKKFMIDQLEQSIDFDCKGNERYYAPPVEQSFGEWVEQKRKSLEQRVQSSQKYLDEEIARTNARNAFLKEFRELLENYDVL